MDLKVLRAHSYGPIERIRSELAAMPSHWLDAVSHIPFIVLPDALSPLWIGLMHKEDETHDGRRYSEVGAWSCYTEDFDPNFRWAPHIYLRENAIWSVVHEVAHALEGAWPVDVDDFFRPEKAFYDYMAATPGEYFGCAVEAFVIPGRDDARWNNHCLAEADLKLWQYLTHQARPVG